jgi:parallel beta-helix repeat protein
MEGVGMVNTLNSRILKVYVHDVIAGQGLYMSNSQYCSISRCQIYNIGDNTAAHYGSGIAFGEASSTKVATSHITIDRVLISKTSMSSIDLEPANNIAITNCVFRTASSWKGYNNPVITEYNKAGYAANDYVTVSGCNVNGAFNEFVVLTPSSHSAIKNNVVTYTSGSSTAIYSTNSHSNTITGNVIKTSSSRPIQLVSCSSCTVSGNTILAR